MTGKKERFYGRRKGRPLNRSRHEALSLLTQIGLTLESLSGKNEHKKHQKDQDTGTCGLDPASLFSFTPEEVHLEIGFGNGDFLACLQHNFPENAFIGAEPYMNGVAACLKKLQQQPNLENIRLWPDDARPFLDSLAAETLDKIYVLNPDPWPKTRHHKRRIINPKNLDRFARVLRQGGSLFMTTDVKDLAEWMAIQTVNHPGFRWVTDSPSHSTIPPEGWIPTRYEKKGRQEGRCQYYLTACRI